MTKLPRHERVRLHPYVERELAKRLAEFGAASGIASSSVVQAALRQYLDRTSDTALILRRLDRLGRADARAHRDLELLSEAFAVWVKIWFVQTPRIDGDAKELARRTAESRYPNSSSMSSSSSPAASAFSTTCRAKSSRMRSSSQTSQPKCRFRHPPLHLRAPMANSHAPAANLEASDESPSYRGVAEGVTRTGCRAVAPRGQHESTSSGTRPRSPTAPGTVSNTSPRAKPSNTRPCRAEARTRGGRPPFEVGFGFPDSCSRAGHVRVVPDRPESPRHLLKCPWTFVGPRAQSRRRMSILRSTWAAPIDEPRCRRERNPSGPRATRRARRTNVRLASWTGETLGQAEERHEK
jgi:hypothetical protein